MSKRLDDAITRLCEAHKKQKGLAGQSEASVALSGACEDRDAILLEVIELGCKHLAAFGEWPPKRKRRA
jgi:hypothetical protein